MCMLAVVVVYRTLHHKDILYTTKVPSIFVPRKGIIQAIPLADVSPVYISANHHLSDTTAHVTNNCLEEGGFPNAFLECLETSSPIEYNSPHIHECIEEVSQQKEQIEQKHDNLSTKLVVELNIPDGSDEYSELSDDLLSSFQTLYHEGHETEAVEEVKTELMSAAISKSLSLSQSFSSFSDLDASYHSRSSSSASSESSSFASIN